MAVVIGYFFCWLTQKGAAPWIQILCMAYFVLNPVFSIYAVTMWKDILFSAFTLLYLLQLYNILQSGGIRHNLFEQAAAETKELTAAAE